MPTNNQSPARILIAEDHALFRHGLATLLNDQPDLDVVGQASDGLEAVQLARELNVDLVVMDINMPISDGLEATRLIHQILPDVKIMVLTINEKEKMLFEAIKAGAGGYMLKSADADEVLEGVRQMLAGQAVLPPQLAAQLLQEFGRMARQTPEPATPQQDFGLTDREMEVLQFIATGDTDKEIARKLDISPYTVKSHVRKILSKLHAANRWEAARRARKENLLDE